LGIAVLSLGNAIDWMESDFPIEGLALDSMGNAIPRQGKAIDSKSKAFPMEGSANPCESGVFRVATAAAAVLAAPLGTRREEAPVVSLAAVGTGAAFRGAPPRRGTKPRHGVEHPSAAVARPTLCAPSSDPPWRAPTTDE
jgi:hypothetical protein